MNIQNGVLDLAPIPQPLVKSHPDGKPYNFFEAVRQAGMRNVVSTFDPPDVRIHAGARDFKVVRPGKVAYCLAEANLPGTEVERAREILRRLAYGFHDWAARETVARYHRDLKRVMAQNPTTTGAVPASLKIKRYLKGHPGATVGEISNAVGVAQPNVSRTLAQWQSAGRVNTVREGRTVKCYLTPNQTEDRTVEAEGSDFAQRKLVAKESYSTTVSRGR